MTLIYYYGGEWAALYGDDNKLVYQGHISDVENHVVGLFVEHHEATSEQEADAMNGIIPELLPE